MKNLFVCKSALKLGIAALGLSLLSACSTMEDVTGLESPELPELSFPKFSNPFKKPEQKLPGERIPVMSVKRGGAPELDVGAATAITALPVITTNTEWTQPGGLPNNAPGHLALSSSLSSTFHPNKFKLSFLPAKYYFKRAFRTARTPANRNNKN